MTQSDSLVGVRPLPVFISGDDYVLLVATVASGSPCGMLCASVWAQHRPEPGISSSGTEAGLVLFTTTKNFLPACKGHVQQPQDGYPDHRQEKGLNKTGAVGYHQV